MAPSWRRFLQGLVTLDSKKHGQHNRTSLASYLFPNANLTRQARARLFNFRYWFLPSLRQRAQSSIYQYLVKRQARREGQRYPFVVSNPQGRTPTFWRRRYVKHGLGWRKRAKMAYAGTPAGSSYGELGGLRAEGREPGARRKKLAGYLKAANELRQSYFAQEGGVSARDFGGDLSGVEGPGAFPEAATVRSGSEEMILFPSYARRHVKRKMAPPPQTADISEQDYWQREWDRHQDDNAVVDVEVRGWIYTPHRGQANRKQRLMIGLARQLSGLPAPPTQRDYTYSSQASSAEPSPHRPSGQDEEIIAREAENIVRRGEQEQSYARRGAFSEEPMFDKDGESVYGYNSRDASRDPSPERGRYDPGNKRASHMSSTSSIDGDADSFAVPQRRSTWRQPEKMSAAELTTANGHLLNRLRLFMANPLQSAPITCFFYNESCSRQHTVETNASGHFTCRAPLDFVPTHVRVLASEKLAATEDVHVTSPKGVSMISDIDDTIKHSAISAGAREIFRNAFIRELGDLTIEGVREWYNTMTDMGVQLHYVSNSPWQLYPVLASYFKLAQLPKGSFHLKQYSGYLQGIFEPVAERKKSSLEKIMGDFPDRKFILVGDSGEADLEVYTDVALENPGRVLGIFIRDVTTSVKTGYFDPSNSRPGSGKSSRNHSRNHSRHLSGDTLAMSKRISRPDDIRDDDKDLKAAIAASLADMEEETQRARRRINPDAPAWGEYADRDSSKVKPRLPPRRGTDQTVTAPPHADQDLIDLSEDVPPPKQPWLTPPPSSSPGRDLQRNGSAQSKPSPSPPPKPQALRSPSPTPPPDENSERRESSSKPAPPRPRKPSSAVKPPSPAQIQTWTSKPPTAQPQTPSQHQRSPLSQVTQNSPEATAKERPPLPARPKTYAVLSKGLASAYNALPTAHWRGAEGTAQQRPPVPPNKGAPGEVSSLRTASTMSTQSTDDLRASAANKKTAPPPPPARRRPATSYNTQTAARKSTNRNSGSGGWDEGGGFEGGYLPGSPSEAGVSRKEFLWQQRWARARSVLERQGVTLRSWRAGIDVADVCVKLVEQAQREIKRDEERERAKRERQR